MTAAQTETENAEKVIWAIGNKRSGDSAHAYLSKQDYKNGICVCGKTVKPYLRVGEWDLSQQVVKEHTCTHCRERIKLLDYMTRDRK